MLGMSGDKSIMLPVWYPVIFRAALCEFVACLFLMPIRPVLANYDVM